MVGGMDRRGRGARTGAAGAAMGREMAVGAGRCGRPPARAEEGMGGRRGEGVKLPLPTHGGGSLACCQRLAGASGMDEPNPRL